MKLIYYVTFTLIISNGIISCKKNEVSLNPVASLNVINAVIGGGYVKVNSISRDSAKVYNAKSFALNATDGTIRIYPTVDSIKPYYLQKHELRNGGVYSMFLFGNPPSPETLFIEDVSVHYTDSAFGIRVINLASGSSPVNVSIAANPSTNILENVAYKDLSDFVKISLPKVVPAQSVTFEIKDAGTGDILLTYTLPEFEEFNYPGISIAKQRFKGITLVAKGIAGETDGPDAFGVFPVVTSY